MSTRLPDVALWRRRPLTIPPRTPRDWLHLAVWQIWMGILIVVVLGFGVGLIATSPDRLYTMTDLSACYAPPPVALPCERILYRGGVLNLAFTSLFGFMLLCVAAWCIWELWSAAEPRPVTDDFLALLHESFGRDWRNPLTWPWARVGWAFGFTTVGALLAVAVAAAVLSFIAPGNWPKLPTPRVETSQSFRPVP